jgi:predicted anti-sigma-YlaC factor YlaD
MNTGSPHLDVDQLLADFSGGAPDDPARVHLAGCPACRAEQDRWAAVAAGVRHLVAATPPPPGLPHQPGPLHTIPAARPPRRRRSAVLAVAAAAALVAGGTVYGITATHGDPSSAPGTTAGLVAVHGCPGKFIAAGNLEQVSGTNLTLGNPSLPSATVATSASTVILGTVTGTLRDVTVGAHVVVTGTWSGRTFAAAQVGIDVLPPTPRKPLGLPRHPRHHRFRIQRPPKGAPPPPFVVGTVVHLSDGSFTVSTRGVVRLPGERARVEVSTSSSTKVLVNVRRSLSQLRIGAAFVAVGRIGRTGVPTASYVAEEPMLRIGFPGTLQKLRPTGCSAAAITTAFLTGG